MIPKDFWGMVAPGFAGSWMSHQALLTQAPSSGSTLIFEDDAVPAVDFDERFKKLMEQVPRDWEGLWLGWAPGHGKSELIDQNCARLHGPLNTHAYVVRGNLRKHALEQNPEHWKKSHWDGMLQRAAEQFKVYGPRDGTLVSQAIWLGAKDPTDNYRDTRTMKL